MIVLYKLEWIRTTKKKKDSSIVWLILDIVHFSPVVEMCMLLSIVLFIHNRKEVYSARDQLIGALGTKNTKNESKSS